MMICKNKASGKYFILISDISNEEARLVTPRGEIKTLRIDLFGNLEEGEESDLLQKGIITRDQVKKFHKDKKFRFEDFVENTSENFERLSPNQQDEVIQILQEIRDKRRSRWKN